MVLKMKEMMLSVTRKIDSAEQEDRSGSRTVGRSKDRLAGRR